MDLGVEVFEFGGFCFLNCAEAFEFGWLCISELG